MTAGVVFRRVVIASIIVGIAVLGPLAFRAAAVNAQLTACGANSLGNKVLVSFELGRARDFWTRFPNAGRAPELELDESAFVLVFDGPATHVLLTNPTTAGQSQRLSPRTRDSVVCVVVGGVPNLYSNVNETGFVP